MAFPWELILESPQLLTAMGMYIALKCLYLASNDKWCTCFWWIGIVTLVFTINLLSLTILQTLEPSFYFIKKKSVCNHCSVTFWWYLYSFLFYFCSFPSTENCWSSLTILQFLFSFKPNQLFLYSWKNEWCENIENSLYRWGSLEWPSLRSSTTDPKNWNQRIKAFCLLLLLLLFSPVHVPKMAFLAKATIVTCTGKMESTKESKKKDLLKQLESHEFQYNT